MVGVRETAWMEGKPYPAMRPRFGCCHRPTNQYSAFISPGQKANLLKADVISDLLLVAAPMRLLWRVQLQRGLKLRLRAVFATTLIGTAVSLYHAYCVLRFSGIPEFLAATLQVQCIPI